MKFDFWARSNCIVRSRLRDVTYGNVYSVSIGKLEMIFFFLCFVLFRGGNGKDGSAKWIACCGFREGGDKVIVFYDDKCFGIEILSLIEKLGGIFHFIKTRCRLDIEHGDIHRFEYIRSSMVERIDLTNCSRKYNIKWKKKKKKIHLSTIK